MMADDYVTCAVCGEHKKTITVQHVKMHGMTMLEYKEQYPNSNMSSESYRSKQRKNAEKQWANPKARDNMRKMKNELYANNQEIKGRISKSLTGKKQPEETIEKRRQYGIKRYEDPEERRKTGIKSMGHIVSKESRKKIGFANTGKKNGMYGLHPSEETRKKLSECRLGDKNHAWLGGISFGEYCPKFNTRIKQEVRDKYSNCDFVSGLHKDICNGGRNLDVHHVDYNKEQGCDDHAWVLIPLSKSNHAKTNYNRYFWNVVFKNTLDYDNQHQNNNSEQFDIYKVV